MSTLESDNCTRSRIAIGTAQFGLSYGVANQSGIVPKEIVKKILQEACAYGINTLDTAISYGISEKILGKIGIAPWQVISKLPRVPCAVEDIPGYIVQQVEGSLEKLNIGSLDGLLMHDPKQLLEESGSIIYRTLCDLRQQGLIKKIGISIYDPQDLEMLIRDRDFNIVQGPFNAFDQRMLTSGWLAELDKMNIEFHARSIFLQGLLLMQNRPNFFEKWTNLFSSWDQWLSKSGLTSLEGALLCAISNCEIKKIILGLDSLGHLHQIMRAIERVDGMSLSPPQFEIQDSSLLNPSKWDLR